MSIRYQQATIIFETRSVMCRIPLALAVATVMLIALFLSLSHWQWSRAHEKQQLLSTILTSQKQTRDFSAMLHLPVAYSALKIKGQYLPQETFILDGRSLNGKLGFVALTVFKPDKSKRYLLVERGWKAYQRGDNKYHISNIPGTRTIEGMVHYPKHLLRLSKQFETDTHWPKIIPSIDLAMIAQQLGVPLHPFIIVLKQGQRGALHRYFKPVVVMPARHYSYAIQWLAFAIIALCVTVGFCWERKLGQDEQND